MADFFSQFQVHPPQDFNLGGFQPAPVQLNTTGMTGQRTPLGGFQQQTPSAPTFPSDWNWNGGITGQGQDPRLLPQQPGSDFGMGDSWGSGVLPPGGYGGGASYDGPPGARGGPGTLQNPMKPQPPGAPSSGMGYSNQTGQLYGPLANGIGNWMQGRPAAVERMASGLSPQQLSGVAGSLGADIGQPSNPSQQSGMVLMQSPDGLHMQNVPQEHVAHYTGLGATQVNGQQLTGSSYGGGNG